MRIPSSFYGWVQAQPLPERRRLLSLFISVMGDRLLHGEGGCPPTRRPNQ